MSDHLNSAGVNARASHLQSASERVRDSRVFGASNARYEPAHRAHVAALRTLLLEDTQNGQSTRIGEMVRRLGCTYNAAKQAVEELLRSELAIKRPGMEGYQSLEVRQRENVSLFDVLSFVESRIDDNYKPVGGRKRVGATRAEPRINSRQFQKIEMYTRQFAEYWCDVHSVPTGDEPTRRVPGKSCSWDPTAAEGRGEWRLVADFEQMARERHRARYEASGRPWRVSDAEVSVSDAGTAARLLCNVAATPPAGILDPSPHTVTADTTYDRRWLSSIQYWARTLQRRGNRALVDDWQLGAKELAIVATRLGGTSIRDTDWAAVRDTLRSRRANKTIHQQRYYHARTVYRAVLDALRKRGVVVSGALEWHDERRPRLSVGAATNADVERAGDRSTNLDLDSIRADSGEAEDSLTACGLVDGYYGIAAWLKWAGLEAHQLAAAGLPPRAWAFAGAASGRGSLTEPPGLLSFNTAHMRLSDLQRLAGFVRQRFGVDWRTNDLSALTLEHVLAYATYLETPQDVGPPPPALTTIADRLLNYAYLFAGFLGQRATQACTLSAQRTLTTRAVDLTDAMQDSETAPPAVEHPQGLRQRFEEAYQRICEHQALVLLASEAPTKAQRLVRTRARNLAIARKWRGDDGVDGLRKIVTLTECCIQSASKQVGGLSLEQQLSALASGSLHCTARWNRDLYLASVLTFAVLIPFRARAMVQLELDMWESEAVLGGLRHSGARHEGAVVIRVPGGPTSPMKSKRPFEASLIARREVGVSQAEALFRRPLWELYFAPGGVREQRLTIRGYDKSGRALDDRISKRASPWILDSPFVFPADAMATVRARRAPDLQKHIARRGQSGRHRLTYSLNAAIQRYQRDLGVSFAELTSQSGATGFHVLRRLYGTHHAPHDLISTALRLDHSNLQFTRDVYCAIDGTERTLLVR